MCQLHPVTFHGDTIFCVTVDNQPFTPVKPIVENMGLDWASQYRKLNENKARWSIVIMTMETSVGPRETVCMPVRKLPAFLASINPKKVKPELREKIELYQNECDDALWDYWTKGRAERQPAIDHQATPSTVEDRRALVTLVNAWAQASGLPHASLWPQVSGYFNLERIADLPKEWLPDAVAFVQERLDALAQAKAQPELPAPDEAPALPCPGKEGPLQPALIQLKTLAKQMLDVELDVYHNARGRAVVTTETPRMAVEANKCAEKLYSASLEMLEAYLCAARVLAYAFQQTGRKAR